MEQEWTEEEEEEEESGTSTVELLDDTLSGEELDDHIPSSSTSRKPRRSTRTAILSRLNTSNEEELEASPDVEVEEEAYEEQEEWKPPEKAIKRRKKAPITRRKRRERSEKQQQPIIKHSISTGRPRGRPRRFIEPEILEPQHSEGQFDVYDEDKTPEREVAEEEEDVIPVIEIDDDDEKEDSDVIYIPDEPVPDSPIPPPYDPPTQRYHNSVVVYGLEESEEEEDSSPTDSERTISDDDHNFDHRVEEFDLEEIQRPFAETAQGSGAIVIDTFRGHQHAAFLDDDEDTQYSVEAELAQYAREDEINAQLDREMEEIGLKEDGIGQSRSAFPEERIDRSRIQALRLDDEVARDPMDYQSSAAAAEEGPARRFAQVNDDEIQEVVYGGNQFAYNPEETRPSNNEQHEYFDDAMDYVENPETQEEELLYPAEEEMEKNMTYQSASPAPSETSTIEITMSQLSIGGEVIEVPDLMLENESFFCHVLSKETFASLTEEQQNHLKRFLPKSCETERDVKKCINSALNYNPNHYFGSPVTRAFNRIRAGYYNVDRPSDLLQLQDNRRVWYDHFIRQYYMKLLKNMLLTRQAILEQAANLPEHVPIKIACAKFSNLKKRDNQELIKYRAKKRARILINFAAEKTGNDTPSSDDSDFEDADDPTHLPIKHEVEGESTHFSPEYADCDLDMYQPAKMKSIKDLLKEFRTLKKKNPNCPSLDTSDITLEDVYERSGLSFQSERNFALPQQQQQQCQPIADESTKKRRRRRKPKVVEEVAEEECRSPASVEPAFEMLDHS